MGANETAIDLVTPLELLVEHLATNVKLAQRMAQEHFPFEGRRGVRRRRISLKKQIEIFQRDKYRCRYFGDRLVFPGVLILLEKQLGEECFPADRNYRVVNSHWIYWWLWPVVDHKEAVPAGVRNPNDPNNLVTTSTFRNIQKGPWTMDQMRWRDMGLPSADEAWDGMTGWFRRYMGTAPSEVWHHRNLRQWARAIGAIETAPTGESQQLSTCHSCTTL